MESKKAIVVVSFGTSYEETRKQTIEVIEQEISASHPDIPVFRAWTSKMILKKILKRDGIKIFNVKEVMEKLKEEGYREVLLQPTHIVNGIENDLMKEDAKAFEKDFERISFGNPLLTSTEDMQEVADIVAKEIPTVQDEALVFMGHGTEHYVNATYAAMDYIFKERGYRHIFMGTVEAYPELENVMRQVKNAGYKKVKLAPFMLVAGDHAKNDMAGEESESWKNQFIQAGFETDCLIKGLGEYKGIRDLFLKHANEAMR
ncbi:MAG TPA: sirohydrochlorin cobaltochelatase [Lachnospiraceae bacterium]